jgi:flagellum-specific peptidoglycan hydrolase FlgJ
MTPSPEVIAAAQAAQRAYAQAPTSVTIAQFGQESGWGKSMPPDSFNPFGIKALAGQPFVMAQTHEVVGGRAVRVLAPFRKYGSLAEAFLDHARLLATEPVYAEARGKLPDIAGYVQAMAAHYATDPHYAEDLLALIRGDGLAQYDLPFGG